jgi:lipopolysaccharide export system protein LptA
MVRVFVFLFLILKGVIGGEPLEVTSDRFTSDEKKHLAIFEGNAKATQGESRILAQKFIVYLDKNNSAKEYKAVGGVTFEIIKPKQHIKGRCKELKYRVKEDIYTLEGDAVVNDILNKRKMSADRLVLDNKNSTAEAISKKRRPVKLIFQVNDIKQDKKEKNKR